MNQNQYEQVPRRGPDKRKIITDGFPETDPIFWGPNQRILEDDVYVPPDGFVHNRILAPPTIVRFIYDARQEYVDDLCTTTAEDFRIWYHAIPVNPAMGSLPWVATAVDGEWWPDKDTSSKTVEVLTLDVDGNAVVYNPAMVVDDAIDRTYIKYDYWRVEVDFTRSDGSIGVASFTTTDEPRISWTSDRAHLLIDIPCSAYPSGCAC